MSQFLEEINTIVEPPVSYRLPKNLVPYHYDLTIQPYFSVTEVPEYFMGQVAIHFRCVQPTHKFVIHMKDLEVYNSTIKISSSTDADFSELKGLKWDYDAETSFLTISLLSEGQVFRAGNNYTFESEYKGFSKNDNIGFYRTLYTDDNGVKKYAVTSQLEYIEARKSFLSFDEPELKSTFSITIIHEENLHAMSNMPISKKTNM